MHSSSLFHSNKPWDDSLTILRLSITDYHLMIYSNACAYAIRALTRIALIRPDGYVLLDELCQDTDLPKHFVAKIFQQLVREKLLVSAKGRGGGFALAKSSEEICLLDILLIVDGPGMVESCAVGLSACNDDQPCPQHEYWKPIRQSLKKFLTDTKLSDMGTALEEKLKMLGMDMPQLKTISKPLERCPAKLSKPDSINLL